MLAFPITLVKKQGGVTLLKACDDTDLTLGQSTQCTVSATNTTFDPAQVVVSDWLPVGAPPAQRDGREAWGTRGFVFQGPLAPAQPPGVTVAPGSLPRGLPPAEPLRHRAGRRDG